MHLNLMETERCYLSAMKDMQDTYNSARPARGLIRHDGFDFGYAIEGQGRVLLIPGSAIYYPRCFVGSLRRHRQLVFLDHRGFARPRRDLEARDGALETALADIETLRRRLGITDCDVLGHSGHGYMALDYARHFLPPNARVILVGTGPSHASQHMQAAETRWQQQAFASRKAQFARDLKWMDRAIADAPEQRFVWMCLGMAARSWVDPSYDARPLWQGVRVNMPVIDSLWGGAFCSYDPSPALRQLGQRLLIMMGQQDYLVAPPECWMPYLEQAPDVQLHLFDHSSHTPQLEEPEAFTAKLLDFLG